MTPLRDCLLAILVCVLLHRMGHPVQGAKLEVCNSETQTECYICDNNNSPSNDTCSGGFFKVYDDFNSSFCNPGPPPATEITTSADYSSTDNVTEVTMTEVSVTEVSVTENVTYEPTTLPTTTAMIGYILCRPCHHLCKTCQGDGVQNCTKCKYGEEDPVDGVCHSQLEGDDDDSTGIIVGAVVGGVSVVLIVIIVVVVVMCRRKRKSKNEGAHPMSLQQIPEGVESNRVQSDEQLQYENIPGKQKGFGQLVQRKQDDITRYKRDPTVKEKTEPGESIYENRAIVAMHQKDTKPPVIRNDSHELTELKALGDAPPPPMSAEPSEDYANLTVAQDNNGGHEMASDGLEDYQNVPSNLRRKPTNVVADHQTDIAEPNEDYQNVSEIRGSGQVNQGFVQKDDLEPYGNEEIIEQWRRSAGSGGSATNEPIYGNVPIP